MCFENDARGTGLSPTVIIIHTQAVFVKGLGKICPYPCDTEAESKIVKMSKKQNSLYEGEFGEKEVEQTKEETDQDQTVDIEEVRIQKESENKSEFVEEELKQEKKKVKNSIRKNYRKAKKKS